MNTKFTFSAGVWNLNTGSDPFGPAVRQDKEFAEKCRTFKRLGFDFVQLHDDDAVPVAGLGHWGILLPVCAGSPAVSVAARPTGRPRRGG